ncbi:hypothetical protein BT96DRAFT_317825 [Gymnopus androsaceus JB14]|uniref:Uncharacterized protein n=1 Tax=Gymnopus androsaceus JB14 TaxID=1447944 RepID=A0A6A4H0K5_9AGAR|nr:hypothetical protein BT96DRAFT_317825 [Gymnopus androsaceus JB14]
MKEVYSADPPSFTPVKWSQRLLQFIGGLSTICSLFILAWPYRANWTWPYRGDIDETTFFTCLRLLGPFGTLLFCFSILPNLSTAALKTFLIGPPMTWIFYLQLMNCFLSSELGLRIPLYAFVNMQGQHAVEDSSHVIAIIGTVAAYTMFLFVNIVLRPTIIFFAWYIASHDYWSVRNLKFWGVVKLCGLSIWGSLVKLGAMLFNLIRGPPRPAESDLPL